MKILFLDDRLERWQKISIILDTFNDTNVDWAETADKAIKFLQENKYDVVMLDHDLNGRVPEISGKGTGYEVAQWIAVNLQDKMPIVYLHTVNPSGAKYMKFVLPNSVIIPFPTLLQQLKEL